MDTITQVTLGAAVGEVVLGKKIGNKAAAWGAIFGVVPDLDVLASPFVSQAQELVIHRGITHSLFFSVITPFLFGWALHRWYQRAKHRESAISRVPVRQWGWLVFWAIITHIFIDSLTNYGTQIFQPFSTYAVSLNTIFIIDPLYTLPLMIGIVGALFMRRSSRKRRIMNGVGIGLSSLYLLWGFGVKLHVDSVFKENFRAQEIPVEQYMTTPMPFNSLLWVAYGRSEDHVYTGLYSILDDERIINFTAIPMRKELLADYRDDLPTQRALWFSQGYYSVRQKGGNLIFSDLRFGRSDLWLSENTSSGTPEMAWRYFLLRNDEGTEVTGLKQVPPSFDMSSHLFKKLWRRILGKTP